MKGIARSSRRVAIRGLGTEAVAVPARQRGEPRLSNVAEAEKRAHA